MEKGRRKVTIDTNDKLVGEQFLKVCENLYELLETENIACSETRGLKNVVLNISVNRETRDGVEKTIKDVHLAVFYKHPLAKDGELKISLSWNNQDLLRLRVCEPILFGGGDKYIIVNYPLQPSGSHTFEELFARLIVYAIKFCFELLEQLDSEQRSRVNDSYQKLEAIAGYCGIKKTKIMGC